MFEKKVEKIGLGSFKMSHENLIELVIVSTDIR